MMAFFTPKFEIDNLKEVNIMMEKTINGRIINKHDLAENWNKAVNFIPKQGEIIIYDIDDNYDYERIKIGDGESLVGVLPFINDIITNAEIDQICGGSIEYAGDVTF